jgi:hypothetical protein
MWDSQSVQHACRECAHQVMNVKQEVAFMVAWGQATHTSVGDMARDTRMTDSSYRWLRRLVGADTEALIGLNRVCRFRIQVADALEKLALDPVTTET